MKVLYSGTLDPFGTCYSRLVSMRQLHDEITEFATDGFHQRIAAIARLKRDFAFSNIARLTNQELRVVCDQEKPDVLWIDTGEWLGRDTLQAIKQKGIFTVRHITDALYPKNPLLLRMRRHRLRRTIKDFDLVFTTNEKESAELRGVMGSRIQLTDLGYDHRRFDSSPLSAEMRRKWSNEIIFVGHYEARTEAAILALIRAGLPVTVYGHPPWFRSENRDLLGTHLQPSLSNEDYQAALKGTKIGLCFVSEWNHNQTAGRSFEIPGSGTFLLAMRTPHHLEYYREGVEAEFFGDHDELVRKARYYLEHATQRSEIAQRGHRRCVESGYSWDAIMKRDWERLLIFYKNHKQSTRHVLHN